MPLIQIEELNNPKNDEFTLRLNLDNLIQKTISWYDPFIIEDREQLNWYFEEYPSEPYIAETQIERASDILNKKGVELFQSIFGLEDIHPLFNQLKSKYAWEEWIIELIGQSNDFFEIYWESMAPAGKPPLATWGVQFVRKSNEPNPVNLSLNESPTLNLLIVSARPGEERDVNPHTIQRPVIELIRETGINVKPHVLRPGTFKSLTQHLDKNVGYYHIIHFDLHGSVLEYKELVQRRDDAQKIRFHAYDYSTHTFQVNWGLADIREYEGKRAFLFFESESNDPGKAIPVSAKELALRLEEYRIPVCILNACQSAMQPEASQEQSVAKALMDAGLQLVLAMSHSISVTAASLLMQSLYRHLLEGLNLEKAIARARKSLYRDKNRNAALGQIIELEDWVLPQVYQNRPVNFQLREFLPEEKSLLFQQRYQRNPPPKPLYGFKGRELDILKIEKLLIDDQDYRNRRHLLLRGMIGVGKTTLLSYLAWWWEETRWVDRVIILPIGNRHFGWKDLLKELASQAFLPQSEALKAFADMTDVIQMEGTLDQLFRSPGTQWALIIDQVNVDQSSIREGLTAEVAIAFKRFLVNLPRDMTVIYGSRNDESWLSEGTFGQNVYQLPGLRVDEQYLLARAILKSKDLSLEKFINDDKLRYAFEELMTLMQGFPSVMESVLPLLQNRAVDQLIEQFLDGSLWEQLAPDSTANETKLFICYAHQDKNQVLPLVKELEKKEVNVWIDQFEIKVGDSITDRINEGIASSSLCLIFISPSFLQSSWTQVEFKPFLIQQQLSNVKKLIPVWYQIDEQQMLDYLPYLADFRAMIINADTDLEKAAFEILDAIYAAESHTPFSFAKPDRSYPDTEQLKQYLKNKNVKAAIEWIRANFSDRATPLDKDQKEAFEKWAAYYDKLEKDMSEKAISTEQYQQSVDQLVSALYELS